MKQSIDRAHKITFFTNINQFQSITKKKAQFFRKIFIYG